MKKKSERIFKQMDINQKYLLSKILPVFNSDGWLCPDNPVCGREWFFPELSIILVREGTLKVTIMNEEHILTDRQAVFVNHHVQHTISTFDDNPVYIGVLIFHQAAVFGNQPSLLSVKYANYLMKEGSIPYLRFDDESDLGHKMFDTCLRIGDNLLSDDIGHELIAKGGLCVLWSYILESLDAQYLSSEDPIYIKDRARFNDALSYIADYYNDNITLDDIASSINVSKSECCRCFHRMGSLTPIEYVMRQRIHVAGTMLTDANQAHLSISEIATNVGFNNISYFNKVFKQVTGTTPSSLRSSSKA